MSKLSSHLARYLSCRPTPGRIHRWISITLACLSLIACLPLWAQDSLVNPDFDTDLSGWTLGGDPLPNWSPVDVDDSNSSGSAYIRNTQADASTDVEVLTQCLDIVPGVWEFFFRVLIPTGQDRNGSVVIRYRSYYDINCEGGSAGTGGWLTSVTGSWTELALANPINISVSQFGGAASLRYTIAIRKTEAGGIFEAYVDSARTAFTEQGFEDGFEIP